MEIDETIRVVFEEMKQVLDAKTVIGEPFEYYGHTIIPMMRVGFGFGAGGGGKGEEAGSGAGGGAGISPVAAIVIDDEGVRVLSLSDKTKIGAALAHIMENMPELMEKCMERCGGMMEKWGKEKKGEGSSVEVT